MDARFETDLTLFLRDHRAAALKFATIRLHDEQAALDVLQEAMMGFANAASRYEQDAWKNLFYKILMRRITDHQRKQGWRDRLVRIMSFSQFASSDEDADGVGQFETVDAEQADNVHGASELADAFEMALEQLPSRQQEAYLLRQWQGMSVAETAAAMGCSQGSVKTHLSRAMTALRDQLGEWIDRT